MATKTDFSETEWDQLHTGVTGAGMLVAAGLAFLLPRAKRIAVDNLAPEVTPIANSTS